MTHAFCVIHATAHKLCSSQQGAAAATRWDIIMVAVCAYTGELLLWLNVIISGVHLPSCKRCAASISAHCHCSLSRELFVVAVGLPTLPDTNVYYVQYTVCTYSLRFLHSFRKDSHILLSLNEHSGLVLLLHIFCHLVLLLHPHLAEWTNVWIWN